MKETKIFIVFILFILNPIFNFSYAENLRIHFIDVKEGDAILIETTEGKTILIDAGNCISGFRVVEYLKKNKIYTLDHLIFTHPDLDHLCGAFFVLQMLKVEKVYDNGQDLNELIKYSDIYRWYEELVRNKNYKILKAKDTLSLGNIILRVLWPPQPFILSGSNVNSLVIMLEYRKFRCLLAGDLTIEAEKRLLEEKQDLKADVLKIGHHGANDANCEEFLGAVSPKIAILSVDKANIRGYPAGEVIERLKKTGTQLYRTDENGDIVVSIYPSKHKDFKIKVNEIR